MTIVDPQRIAARVAEVREEMRAACVRVGRDPASVSLMAVTKNQEPAVLPALRQAGIRDFGENRLDHLDRMRTAGEPGDRWHYIGRVQRRQLPHIAPHVHALHSLCDPGHVDRLARACAEIGVRLPVFLQVNTSGEQAKAGLTPAEAPLVLQQARAHAGLHPVGLMTMAPELGEIAAASTVRACFAQLRQLANTWSLPELSMGMSGDFTIAIEEGATVVRVGSRLFA
jgi:PLP dependent protein